MEAVRKTLDERPELAYATCPVDGFAALHIVVKHTPPPHVMELCKLLLHEKKVSPNVQDAHAKTALHRAVRADHGEELIALLIGAGTEVTLSDRKGNTPLHQAFRKRLANHEIVHTLLRLGHPTLLTALNKEGRASPSLLNDFKNTSRYRVSLDGAPVQWKAPLTFLSLENQAAQDVDSAYKSLLEDAETLRRYATDTELTDALEALIRWCGRRSDDAANNAATVLQIFGSNEIANRDPIQVGRLYAAHAVLQLGRVSNVAKPKLHEYLCLALHRARWADRFLEPLTGAQGQNSLVSRCGSILVTSHLRVALSWFNDAIVGLTLKIGAAGLDEAANLEDSFTVLRTMLEQRETSLLAIDQAFGLSTDELPTQALEKLHGATRRYLTGGGGRTTLRPLGSPPHELLAFARRLDRLLEAADLTELRHAWTRLEAEVINACKDPVAAGRSQPARDERPWLERLVRRRAPDDRAGIEVFSFGKLREQLVIKREDWAARCSNFATISASDPDLLNGAPLAMEVLQQEMAVHHKQLFKSIIEHWQKAMGLRPPCAVTMMMLGSLSRGDCLAYPEVEYRFLYEETGAAASGPLALGPDAINYLRELGRLFELTIASLGETPLLDAPHARRGLHIANPASPPHSKRDFALTPNELVERIGRAAITNFAETEHLENRGYDLLTPRATPQPVRTSDMVWNGYAEALQNAPPTHDAPGLDTIKLCAISQWLADIKTISPPRMAIDESSHKTLRIDLNRDFAIPLTSLLSLLGILHEVKTPRALETFMKLKAQKTFVPVFLSHWRWALNTVHTIRIRREFANKGCNEKVCWGDLSLSEQADLIRIEWCIVRPLIAEQHRWLSSTGPNFGVADAKALVDRITTLEDADPAYMGVAWPASSAGTGLGAAESVHSLESKIHSLARSIDLRGGLTGATRDAGLVRAVDKLYRKGIADAEPDACWRWWTMWRNACENVPGGTALLERLRHISRKDGWRADWEIRQREFVSNIPQWFELPTINAEGRWSMTWIDPYAPEATTQRHVLKEAIGDSLTNPQRDFGYIGAQLRPRPVERPATDANAPAAREKGQRPLVAKIRFVDRLGKDVNYWVKLRPECPAVDTLVHGLDNRLTGGRLTPMSLPVLLRSPNGEEFGALVTEDVSGTMSLADALGNPNGQEFGALAAEDLSGKRPLTEGMEDGERLVRIDPVQFTQTLLRVLLVNPEDDSGRDYQLFRGGGRGCQIKRLDNERSFFRVVENTLFGLRSKLQVKSILYCLPQLEEPLNVGVLKEFCKLETRSLLLQFFREAVAMAGHYARLFPSEMVRTEAKDNNRGISLLAVMLPEGLERELLHRLDILQEVILCAHKVNRSITGLELLHVVQPSLCAYYAEAFAKYPGVKARATLNRFNFVTGVPIDKGNLSFSAPKVSSGAPNGSWGVSGSRRLTQDISWGPLKACIDDAHRSGTAGSPHSSRACLQRLSHLAAVDTVESAVAAFRSDESYAAKRLSEMRIHERAAVIARINSALLVPGHGFTEAAQRRVLIALAQIPFVRLDLTGFYRVLTDNLLAPILSGVSRTMLELNLDHCTLLTFESLKKISECCPLLTVLSLSGFNGSPLSGIHHKPRASDGGSGYPGRQSGGVAYPPLSFPVLQSLDISHSAIFSRVHLSAPRLRHFLAEDAASLKEIVFYGTPPTLQTVNIRGCVALTQSALSQLKVDFNDIRQFEAGRCTKIGYSKFRKAFPWLANLDWRDTPEDVVDRFELALTGRVGETDEKIEQERRASLRQLIANWIVLTPRVVRQVQVAREETGRTNRAWSEWEALHQLAGHASPLWRGPAAAESANTLNQLETHWTKLIGDVRSHLDAVCRLALRELIALLEPTAVIAAWERGNQTDQSGRSASAPTAVGAASQHQAASQRGQNPNRNPAPNALQRAPRGAGGTGVADRPEIAGTIHDLGTGLPTFNPHEGARRG